MSEKKREQIVEEQDDQEINLLEYIIVLAKHKKLIISITLSVAIVTFILTLFTHTFYKAETSILPAQQNNSNKTSQIMSQFGFFTGINNNYGTRTILVETIKSRTFANEIIAQFNLKTLYGAKDLADARNELFKHVKISPDFTESKSFDARTSKSPLMWISVLDGNAQRSANIANAIVELLKKHVNDLTISEAAQRRLFFERQLRQANDALLKAEEDMKAFQEKTGILEVKGNMNITINKFAPALILEYKRLFRQLKFNETLYEITAKQYETAKQDEAKDAPFIHVIDKAVPPEKEGKNRIFGRAKALAFTVFSFFFSCLLAFILEFHNRSSANKEYIKNIATLKGYLPFKKDK